MRVAAVAYAPERLPGWAAHAQKLNQILSQAKADLVVLPEYAALEAALLAAPPRLAPLAWRDLAAERAGSWVDQMRHMAGLHHCYILGGSGPVQTVAGVVNRAWLVSPWGDVVHQDKVILTPYERDVLEMVPGQELTLIETPLGKIGILICYDSEFPLLARALIEAGAEILLVPSCTDLPQGQTRVRVSARARAVEGQCLVIQAPLVGQVAGCEIIDVSTGRAGIFAPPDHGLPPDGILAQGAADCAGVTLADIDLAAVTAARATGQVGNMAHWPEQVSPATRIAIRSLSRESS